jgi:hypothetical protein
MEKHIREKYFLGIDGDFWKAQPNKSAAQASGSVDRSYKSIIVFDSSNSRILLSNR